MIIPVQQLKKVFDKCTNDRQNKTAERSFFNLFNLGS